ncbi:hypothetical protein QJS66_09345 [Kocuria rhizophila]|nr:hypothetical protein QJS66_09345 [Kocuria rhizophila]
MDALALLMIVQLHRTVLPGDVSAVQHAVPPDAGVRCLPRGRGDRWSCIPGPRAAAGVRVPMAGPHQRGREIMDLLAGEHMQQRLSEEGRTPVRGPVRRRTGSWRPTTACGRS